MTQTIIFVPQDATSPSESEGSVTIDNGKITLVEGVATGFVRRYRDLMGMSDQDTFNVLSNNWSNGYYLTFPKPE
jgi:hypothetical protein